MLENLNVDLDEIRYEIMKTLDPEYDADSEDDYEVASDDATPAGGSEATASPGRSKSKTPALNSFGRDLNKLAEDHVLDPVIGREQEIERVIQILCRRTKTILFC